MIILNSKEIITEKYPNNEIKVKDFENYIQNGENILEFKYKTDEDLLTLMFTKKRIDEFNISCTLFIWYMPYSRMDRKIEGDLFTLKYITDFINWLNFEKIVVMEPHSDKTIQMLKKANAVYPVKDWLEKVQKEIGFSENDYIVFPDKGAAERYSKSNDKNICTMEKKRNPITGNIEDMYLKSGKIKPGSKCIILDDLCSKGGTFAWAGSILKSLGASEVYLIVSHCEETILEGKLLTKDSPISKIYTSTSIINKEHPKIKYMDINVRKLIKE